MENINPNTPSTAVAAKVQHVTKSSSDQLLSKFAEMGSESEDKLILKKELRLAKRRKKTDMTKGGCGVLNGISTALGERKSLLHPANSRTSTALIRKLGIGKAKVRAREFKNKSFIDSIEKTWRRTVEGASRVFMEKHYNRHKRLISDMN